MERKSGLKRLFIGLSIFLIYSIFIGFICPLIAVGEAGSQIKEKQNSIYVEEIEITKNPVNIVIKPNIELIIQNNLKIFNYTSPKNKEEAQLKYQEIIDYIEKIYSIIPPAHKTDLYIKAYLIASPNLIANREVAEHYKNDYETFLEIENEQLKWKARKKEYPEATHIWLYMRNEFNWSPETCAGIIGNMMAEVGGGTLDLSDWDLDESCGYGLIQWIDGRRKILNQRYGKRPTIEEQLKYMYDEMFGYNNTEKQIYNLKYKNALSIIINKSGEETPEHIAFVFATEFERCANQHREMRKGYARIAYEYFMD